MRRTSMYKKQIDLIKGKIDFAASSLSPYMKQRQRSINGIFRQKEWHHADWDTLISLKRIFKIFNAGEWLVFVRSESVHKRASSPHKNAIHKREIPRFSMVQERNIEHQYRRPGIRRHILQVVHLIDKKLVHCEGWIRRTLVFCCEKSNSDADWPEVQRHRKLHWDHGVEVN